MGTEFAGGVETTGLDGKRVSSVVGGEGREDGGRGREWVGEGRIKNVGNLRRTT